MKTLLGVLLATAVWAQGPEVTVLGGPCEPGMEPPVWQSLVSQQLAAVRSWDQDTALVLTRRIVRGRCDNTHWWFRLVEQLAAAGRPQEAVDALGVLYARRNNEVDLRLRAADSQLKELVQTEAFRRSELAQQLARARRELDKRRAAAAARLAAEPGPPRDYVAMGACPFEGCAYREWRVNADTTVYDRPGGTRVMGQARKGEAVDALTGEVHLRPVPVLVRFSTPSGFSAAEGSIVYLLDYQGEGFGRVWVNGRIFSTEHYGVLEHCTFPQALCWGEFVHPQDASIQVRGVWWVQVRTKGGITGWTSETEHFDGKSLIG